MEPIPTVNSPWLRVYPVGIQRLFVMGLPSNPSSANPVEAETKKTNPMAKAFLMTFLLLLVASFVIRSWMPPGW